MGKKYKNLFDKIVDINNLRDAYRKAIKGNRYTTAHLRFKENLETNLFLLQQKLIDNTYFHGQYTTFVVYEPKKREISALPFKDRVVQHAINNIIAPIFEKIFYPCSYACRTNKGVHAGVKATQSTIRKLQKHGNVYYLKMDFKKYFHSINIDILFKEISRKISDTKVIILLKKFNFGSVGIKIGNLLSQLEANIYGHIFDRFIKTKLKCEYYFRYMDDTVIFSNNKNQLFRYQKILQKFSKIYMKLEFSKWQIDNVKNKLINFLGYRICADFKLIRKSSVVRAKRKFRYFLKKDLLDELLVFLASWRSHLSLADCWNLKKYLLLKENLWKKQYTYRLSTVLLK